MKFASFPLEQVLAINPSTNRDGLCRRSHRDVPRVRPRGRFPPSASPWHGAVLVQAGTAARHRTKGSSARMPAGAPAQRQAGAAGHHPGEPQSHGGAWDPTAHLPAPAVCEQARGPGQPHVWGNIPWPSCPQAPRSRTAGRQHPSVLQMEPPGLGRTGPTAHDPAHLPDRR